MNDFCRRAFFARCHRWQHRACLVIAIVGGTAVVPLRAADVSWSVTGSGNFTTGSNWSSGTVPGTADNAIIKNGGTATLTLTGTSAGPRYAIGQDGDGTLLITGGGTSTTSGISYVGGRRRRR
jgi:hypothetical protein